MSGVDEARVEQVMRAIDDPCDEGGFDTFCRNARGELCAEHVDHCLPPEYPCIARLRRSLALEVIATNDKRRQQSD